MTCSYGHIHKCHDWTPPSWSTTLTHGPMRPPFTRNNVAYTPPRLQLLKLRLTNSFELASSTQSNTHLGYPIPSLLTKNKAPSMFALITVTSTPLGQRRITLHHSSTRLLTNVRAMKSYPLWMVSWDITKSRFNIQISTK